MANSHSTDLLLDGASGTLTLLSTQVERFVQEWEAGGAPPTLGGYVAASTPAARRLLAIELIKVDLEYRWVHNGLRRMVEEYLPEAPDLEGRLPIDLLFEEYHVRLQAGDSVDLGEYRRRFPDQADELARLVGTNVRTVSTQTMSANRQFISGLQAGMTIDDFDLLLPLGQGAFASVFLARQRSMQRFVALKVSADRSSEPQTLAQLDHECIVRVYDQRVLPERKLRLLYMQYAAGGTLADAVGWLRPLPVADRSGERLLLTIDLQLEKRGESPPAESDLRERLAGYNWPEMVSWIGARLARALDYAHHQGVLHRDIKPANVLLTAEGLPKLADFNISFCSQLAGAAPEAFFGGSLAYMSPEQLRACNPKARADAAALDGRSDLYSLGVLLWELLTMARPFPDDVVERDWSATIERMLARRELEADPRQLTACLGDRAPGLAEVLCRCLSFDREQRPHSGAEAARDLELCLHPQTQALLRSDQPWKKLVRRFPVTTFTLVTVIPNGAAALFNFAYNRAEIIDTLEGAQELFWRVQGMINAIAFPAGVILGGLLVRSIGRTVQAACRGESIPADELRKQRRRAVFLGHISACISLSLWILAAPAYPIAMHIGLGEVPPFVYTHFLASLALCGLIAAAYPFFLGTFISLRCLCPPLIRARSGPTAQEASDAPPPAPPQKEGALKGEASKSDAGKQLRLDLQQLGRLGWFYFFAAASVPLLSVLLLVMIESKIKFALVGMTIGGIAGLGVIFWALRLLQTDIEALGPALDERGKR